MCVRGGGGGGCVRAFARPFHYTCVLCRKTRIFVVSFCDFEYLCSIVIVKRFGPLGYALYIYKFPLLLLTDFYCCPVSCGSSQLGNNNLALITLKKQVFFISQSSIAETQPNTTDIVVFWQSLFTKLGEFFSSFRSFFPDSYV